MTLEVYDVFSCSSCCVAIVVESENCLLESVEDPPLCSTVISITVIKARAGNRPWWSMRLIVIESIHEK